MYVPQDYVRVATRLGSIPLDSSKPETSNSSSSSSASSSSSPSLGRLRDVLDGRWKPTFGARHPRTGEPLETLMTKVSAQGTAKCLDYVFANVDPRHAEVVPLRAPPEREKSFQQVSDHCAVEVVL